MDAKNINKALSTIVLMAVGGSVGFMAAKVGLESANTASTAEVVTFIVMLLPVFLLVTGVHEAGHALAGKSVNFNFRLYVVGPFMWDKEESGWKFKWNKNLNVAGGLVICIPSSTENLPNRFSIYSLGGPAASLFLAVLAYGAKLTIMALNANQAAVLNVASGIFALMSFLSFVIFIATIIPMHTGGFYTDGARALRFLRGGDVARFETLLMNLITKSYSGIRPKLLNKEEIMEAYTLGKKLQAIMNVYTLYYLFHFAFDECDYEEAETYLREYMTHVDSIPKGLRGSAYLDAAFFYAFARGDLARAESYWRQYVPSAIIPKAQVLTAEAALLNLKSDATAEMLLTTDKALKELPNMMDRGQAIALQEKLTDMKQHSRPRNVEQQA